MLHVIDNQSGETLQSVRLKCKGQPSAILVDGEEIFISLMKTKCPHDVTASNQVVVLQTPVRWVRSEKRGEHIHERVVILRFTIIDVCSTTP